MDLSGRSRCNDYETARILSHRARRIDAGSPPRVPFIKDIDTAESIALKEYNERLLTNYEIIRIHPDGTTENIPYSFLYHSKTYR